MTARLQGKAEERLIQTLACGASIEGAARECGASSRTVHRRLADPEFRRRVQQIRSDMMQRIAGSLTAASTEAMRTLLELMKPTVSPTIRLGAARTVLECAMRMNEFTELEDRVAEMEKEPAEPQRRIA
jgi:hypothetical protein